MRLSWMTRLLFIILFTVLPCVCVGSANTTTSSDNNNNSNSEGTFVWFSDIHLDPYYGTYQAVIHNKFDSGEGCSSPSKLQEQPLGDFGCDSPPALIHSLLQSASSLLLQRDDKVDFGIITGDFVRHGNDLLEDPMNATQSILSNVSTLLQQYFPNIPMVPSLGNNDVTPDYYFNLREPEEMLTMVTNGLEPLLQNQTTNFQQGGFFAVNVTSQLTILSLNTILYSTNRQPPSLTQPIDPLHQFAWMESQLQSAQESNRHVYLMGHIPPSIGSYRHTQLWHEMYLEPYYTIVAKFANVIKGQLFGHIHTDEFRVHAAHLPIFMTSSFTPIYGSNPSYRVVTYDKQTSELLDYHVVYLDNLDNYTINNIENDTNNTNNPNAANWQISESFTQAYQVPDMSLMSLTQIVEDLQNSTDSSRYWEALLTRLHVYTHGTEVCDAECRQEWACTLSSMTKAQYNACMGYAFASVSRRDILVWVAIFMASAVAILIFWRTLRASGGKQFCRRLHYEDVHHHDPVHHHHHHHHHVGPMVANDDNLSEHVATGDQQLPPLS